MSITRNPVNHRYFRTFVNAFVNCSCVLAVELVYRTDALLKSSVYVLPMLARCQNPVSGLLYEYIVFLQLAWFRVFSVAFPV